MLTFPTQIIRPRNMTVVESIKKHRLLPVIQIEDAGATYGLAEALLAGGLPLAEVTLRTPSALKVIETMARVFPKLLVGAGTVSTVEQVNAVVDAGARFVISPGLNPAVVGRCLELGVPVFPGVCTPTDIEFALSFGLETLKFFPAEAAGGVNMLSALAGPYGDLSFIPTGGIGPKNLHSYLSQANVLACGGSWMVNPLDIKNSSFDKIQAYVADAVSHVTQVCDTLGEAA